LDFTIRVSRQALTHEIRIELSAVLVIVQRLKLLVSQFVPSSMPGQRARSGLLSAGLRGDRALLGLTSPSSAADADG